MIPKNSCAVNTLSSCKISADNPIQPFSYTRWLRLKPTMKRVEVIVMRRKGKAAKEESRISYKHYREAMDREIDRQKRAVERPGAESMEQFIIQEEMRTGSFAPRRRSDNPF